MLSSPRARIAYILTLVAALLIMGGLALVVLRQAFTDSAAEAWMMAAVVLVVIGLPLAMVLMSVLGWLRAHTLREAIIPNVGENIPGAGQ